MKKTACTHVCLDVEVLEIESMLPDVNTDDGQERQERVLVRRRRDLEFLRRWVHALSVPVTGYRNDFIIDIINPRDRIYQPVQPARQVITDGRSQIYDAKRGVQR